MNLYVWLAVAAAAWGGWVWWRRGAVDPARVHIEPGSEYVYVWLDAELRSWDYGFVSLSGPFLNERISREARRLDRKKRRAARMAERARRLDS